MISYFGDVKAFHDKFGLVTPDRFVFISDHLFEFRLKFFQEEAKEYEDAHANRDLGETIDALIDMVYIVCGCATLHGISTTEFEHLLDNNTVDKEDLIANQSLQEPKERPHLLSDANNNSFVKIMNRNINQFVDAWNFRNEQALKNSLIALYLNSLYGSYLMGFSNDQWDELWNDVQRANMSKVRATSASQSKRGSSFDVIKPPGWVGPRTEELVAKFLESVEA